MWQFAGRPPGIVVLAVLLVLAGLASLAESVEEVVTAAVGAWPAATLGAIIGLLILYRAYGLWYFRRFAWLMTILILGLKGAVSAWTLSQGYAPHTAWVTLSLVVVIILYLLHPRIRTRFSANQHDS